ncbi:hypothetical protein FRIGORI9N_440044 [Frigoribacterium sp. 9N]|nr:hypothetical protein FRIGORI9N_440044 [Frigoribacterium sp. 9N]
MALRVSRVPLFLCQSICRNRPVPARKDPGRAIFATATRTRGFAPAHRDLRSRRWFRCEMRPATRGPDALRLCTAWQ